MAKQVFSAQPPPHVVLVARSGIGHLAHPGQVVTWCHLARPPWLKRKPDRMCSNCVRSGNSMAYSNAVQQADAAINEHYAADDEPSVGRASSTGHSPAWDRDYPRWQPAVRELLAIERDDYTVARMVWANLSPTEQESLAVYLLGREVWKMRRAYAVQVERSATARDNARQARQRVVTDPEGWAETAKVVWHVPEQLVSATQRAVRDYAQAIRLDITAALLATPFAVGGTRVTWGEATVDQHRARIEEQTQHAAASMDDAARHEAAIIVLTKARKTCLNDLAA